LRLIRRSAYGDGTDEEITAVGGLQYAGSWIPDGRTLYYERRQRETQSDIWAVSPRVREPAPFLASSFSEFLPRLSSDGRWLAYISDENGRAELYVRALQGEGQRWPVSVDGATFAVWAPDGRRLYYRGPGRGSEPVNIWAVDIETSPTFRASRPRPLFPASGFLPEFDITPGGKRFVMVQEDTTPPPQQLHLVLNWFKTQTP
jgi:Tol biopolymer transport system component